MASHRREREHKDPLLPDGWEPPHDDTWEAVQRIRDRKGVVRRKRDNCSSDLKVMQNKMKDLQKSTTELIAKVTSCNSLLYDGPPTWQCSNISKLMKPCLN